MIYHSEAMEGKKITVDGIMTNMAYACAFAAERIMYVLDRRLRARGGRLKHEKKQAFTRLSETLKAAKRYYDMAFDEDLIAAAVNSGDMLDYDRAHHDGNEIARLLLLYSDRCGASEENYGELFRHLRSMEGGLGLITEDVLKDFYMKK